MLYLQWESVLRLAVKIVNLIKEMDFSNFLFHNLWYYIGLISFFLY